MEMLIQIISGLLILIGCVFVIGGAVGLNRMPDLYTRVHAASVTDTGGVLFIFLGLSLQAIFIFDNPMAAVKLGLVILFLFLTAPTASHVVTKAALMANLIPRCPDGQSVVCQSLAPEIEEDETKTPAERADTSPNSLTKGDRQ